MSSKEKRETLLTLKRSSRTLTQPRKRSLLPIPLNAAARLPRAALLLQQTAQQQRRKFGGRCSMHSLTWLVPRRTRARCFGSGLPGHVRCVCLFIPALGVRLCLLEGSRVFARTPVVTRERMSASMHGCTYARLQYVCWTYAYRHEQTKQKIPNIRTHALTHSLKRNKCVCVCVCVCVCGVCVCVRASPLRARPWCERKAICVLEYRDLVSV